MNNTPAHVREASPTICNTSVAHTVLGTRVNAAKCRAIMPQPVSQSPDTDERQRRATEPNAHASNPIAARSGTLVQSITQPSQPSQAHPTRVACPQHEPRVNIGNRRMNPSFVQLRRTSPVWVTCVLRCAAFGRWKIRTRNKRPTYAEGKPDPDTRRQCTSIRYDDCRCPLSRTEIQDSAAPGTAFSTHHSRARNRPPFRRSCRGHGG